MHASQWAQGPHGATLVIPCHQTVAPPMSVSHGVLCKTSAKTLSKSPGGALGSRVTVTWLHKQDSTPLQVHVKETMNLRKVLWDVYHKDTIYAKILAHLEAHPRFRIREGLMTKNQLKWDVICIPKDVFQRGRMLVEIIIDHAHRVIGHYSQFKTSDYI